MLFKKQREMLGLSIISFYYAGYARSLPSQQKFNNKKAAGQPASRSNLDGGGGKTSSIHQSQPAPTMDNDPKPPPAAEAEAAAGVPAALLEGAADDASFSVSPSSEPDPPAASSAADRLNAAFAAPAADEAAPGWLGWGMDAVGRGAASIASKVGDVRDAGVSAMGSGGGAEGDADAAERRPMKAAAAAVGFVKKAAAGAAAAVPVDVAAMKESASTAYADFRQDPKASAAAAAAAAKSAAGTAAAVAGRAADKVAEKVVVVGAGADQVFVAAGSAIDATTAAAGRAAERAAEAGTLAAGRINEARDSAVDRARAVAESVAESERLNAAVGASRVALATATSAASVAVGVAAGTAAAARSRIGERVSALRGGAAEPPPRLLGLHQAMGEHRVRELLTSLEASSVADQSALNTARSSLDDATQAQAEGEIVYLHNLFAELDALDAAASARSASRDSDAASPPRPTPPDLQRGTAPSYAAAAGAVTAATVEIAKAQAAFQRRARALPPVSTPAAPGEQPDDAQAAAQQTAIAL